MTPLPYYANSKGLDPTGDVQVPMSDSGAGISSVSLEHI